MRKQIAAANWKMNLSLAEAESLTKEIIKSEISVSSDQLVLLAVPFPYLEKVQILTAGNPAFAVAAQNCAATKNGAYTGEVSAQMLMGMSIPYVLIGHSERREYFHEDHNILTSKVDLALESNLNIIFCCGEPLFIREAGNQNSYVEAQLKESLFHLTESSMKNVIIAYEPIWAIGTGKTASSDQAQEIHAHIRHVISKQYGETVAQSISILYGGSVKASNAAEIFSKPDVDGGLVGGASLIATEFAGIINSLKR
jgi:triosephosphate isomerase